MIEEYFQKHPKEKYTMEQDWKDCIADGFPGYGPGEMPKPCESFVYGWVMAREPLKERCDYAAQRVGELVMALELEGIDHEEIVEKWREE